MTPLLGSCLLRIAGWRIRGELPPQPKLVIVIAPHTSNWDFVWLLMAKWRLRLYPRWLGKHTLFRPPLGWLMRALGGIPVDRGRRGDLVNQAVAAFRHAERMMLAIAPEGTRRRTGHWGAALSAATVPGRVSGKDPLTGNAAIDAGYHTVGAEARGLINQIVAAVAPCVLVWNLRESGTRGYVTMEASRSHRAISPRRHRKSGFHSIAVAAGAPVVPVALDYARREIAIGAPLTMTGDRELDMSQIRAFLVDRHGRRPGNQGPVRLKNERQ